MSSKEETNPSSSQQPNEQPKKFSLALSKKKSSKTVTATTSLNVFGNEQQQDRQRSTAERTTPLVIPVESNQLRWKHEKNNNDNDTTILSKEDQQAIEALQQQATGELLTNKSTNANKLVIVNNNNNNNNKNTTDNDTLQYKADLSKLPQEQTELSECYDKLPISEFGAALLRGMGWQGSSNNNNNNNDEPMALPRPHRLGLGATPKLDVAAVDNDITSRKRPRRPDQFQKQVALEKQQEEYRRQRELQLAMDKQKTLQNGSIIFVHNNNNKRAQILQLTGVPGLNMVKIQYENDTEPSIIKRGQMGELVSRQELERKPFCKPQQETAELSRQSNRQQCDEKSDKKSNDRSKQTDRHEKSRSTSSFQKRPRNNDNKPIWSIPNIRVRIITEKLGRQYYKEKCVIVDVTPKGVTLQTPGGTVLDRVPERYLETALPKVGGNVVVLMGKKERHTKGRLLERNSRQGTGVIQFFEDMNVMKLSLDDMAEWVGPLDDDLHE